MPRVIRRSFSVLLLLGLHSPLPGADTPAAGVERFYIGTYSGPIYQSSLDLGTGTLGTVARGVSFGAPSFVALTPDRNFLYAVNEDGGTVGAFSVNPTNGVLKLLNQRSSNGSSPAHIVVDGAGRNVIVANYGGGSATVFPILTNGLLGLATGHVQHPAGANAHCTTLDASNRFAFICDKGLDQVRSYVFDATAGTLVTNKTPFVSVTKGSGPRHMTFDPSFKRAYVICELKSTIIGFDYDPVQGVLAPFQTVSTLQPGGFSGANTTAEIVVHPTGSFVYGSNRGKNSIAVFRVNAADGTLTPVQQQSTGATPRSFAIDPTGRFCIVAGQGSNDVRLYRVDAGTGQLTDTNQKLSVPSPVCIVPYLLEPPQPVLSVRAAGKDGFELGIGNTLELLAYEIHRSTTLDPTLTWKPVATGARGQTRFLLPQAGPQEFFRVAVSTNY